MHFKHRWKIVSDNGYSVYKECIKCGKRKVDQPKGGYQPVNHNWLNGKECNLFNFRQPASDNLNVWNEIK